MGKVVDQGEKKQPERARGMIVKSIWLSERPAGAQIRSEVQRGVKIRSDQIKSHRRINHKGKGRGGRVLAITRVKVPRVSQEEGTLPKVPTYLDVRSSGLS